MITPSGFHFYNESLLLKILLILNFPALLISGVVLIPFVFLELNLMPENSNIWLQLVIFSLCSTVQWAMLGYWLNKFLSRSVSFP